MTDERTIARNLKRVEKALAAKGFAAVSDAASRTVSVLKPGEGGSLHDHDELWDRAANAHVISMTDGEILSPAHVEVALRQVVAHFGH